MSTETGSRGNGAASNHPSFAYLVQFKYAIWGQCWAVKTESGTPMPHTGVCGLKSQLCSCFWLPANADPEEVAVMVQVLGALPSAWEIRMGFLAPSFSLVWFWFL